ncbi:MAG: hypothetical protein QXJ94_04940 [Candidatus Bathyarchaeia archaeon]
MFTRFRDKIFVSGVAVLGVGVALLVFTFINAYGFLTQNFPIIASEDFMQTFGAAFAPLIATCIRLMYLGVMGWVGSLLTIRGVTLLVNAPKTEVIAVPQKTTTSQQRTIPTSQKTKPENQKEPKTETRQPEPEIVFIPPEEQTAQQGTSSSQTQQNS